MNMEALTAWWQQLLQNPEAVWAQLMEHFTAMSTRLDGSSAGMELGTMLAVAFILGFLFCSMQGKAKR